MEEYLAFTESEAKEVLEKQLVSLCLIEYMEKCDASKKMRFFSDIFSKYYKVLTDASISDDDSFLDCINISKNETIYSLVSISESAFWAKKNFGQFDDCIHVVNENGDVVDFLIGPDLAKSMIEENTELPRKVKKEPIKNSQKTYFILDAQSNKIKIGKSNDPNGRLKMLQTGCPNQLSIILIIDENVEKALHSKFSNHRLNGEWFAYSDEIKEFLTNKN